MVPMFEPKILRKKCYQMTSRRKKDTTVQFHRWGNEKGNSSWEFKVFKKQHTELFRIYWNYISSNSFTKYLVKKENDKTSNVSVWDFLHIDEEGQKNVENNYMSWNSNNKKFFSWVKLNVLLAMVSNFELYISNIATVAVESNPGLLFEKTERIDGIKYLKNGSFDKSLLKDHMNKIVLETTKGDWHQRIAGIKKYFGEIPDKFDEEVEDLEKMRKLRIDVAHSFGRDLQKAQTNRSVDILAMQSISEKRLIKYSGEIFELTKLLDSFLMKHHIGTFEDIYYYHKHFALTNSVVSYNGLIMQNFQKKFFKASGTKSKNYWEQLIRYYYGLDEKLQLKGIKKFEFCSITKSNIKDICKLRQSLKQKYETDEQWITNNDRSFREFGLNIMAIKRNNHYFGLIGFLGSIKRVHAKLEFVFCQDLDRQLISKDVVGYYLKQIQKVYPYLRYYYHGKKVNSWEKDILEQIW